MMKLDKPLTKLFFLIGLLFTVFTVIDILTWIFSGKGLIENIFGGKTPLLVAIAGQIAQLPAWAFGMLVVASIVVLSWLISLVVIATYKKELVNK